MAKDKKVKKAKKGRIWKVLTIVSAVLLVVCIVAIPISQQFASVLNVALKADTQRIVKSDEPTVLFKSAWESEEELVAHEKKLCRAIEGEGAALLINRDNALPLPKGTKFTPFSQSSFNLLYGGTGSGSMSADDAVSLKAALETVFGENTVNPNQWKFYITAGTSASTRPPPAATRPSTASMRCRGTSIPRSSSTPTATTAMWPWWCWPAPAAKARICPPACPSWRNS